MYYTNKYNRKIIYFTAKLDLAEFHRYPMRLKAIDNEYLGMMDCHEKFMFLLGKQPPENKELDERLKKMIDAYWPEEFQQSLLEYDAVSRFRFH